ncbi:MAG: Rpn family recombination-promoting nuclease/putative transposase [Chroococcidiopsidaceae cyanobacterium CP_BM_ER_R8_30]|nr:Rpn family recombination-promoting nuclease/putative transposase [Chroococcidiopsidaceae cyanobacterium CP_BM_ER_R8_30]
MFDNISKFLAEQFSVDLASWLLGEPITLTELSPSELSLEPIRADALILLQSDEVVLHCEFQTDPDPTMPFRMADYRLRVYRRFPQKRMVQVVVYLRATGSELVQQTTFELDNLRHEFQVVRLWEQPTEVFLQRPGLLPYAALSRTTDRVGVLRQVAQEIELMTDRNRRSNLAAATGILAGLVLDKDTIGRLLRRELMRESVIYQELRQEAREEARRELMRESMIYQELRQEAREEAREEAKQSEVNLLLRLLARHLGQVVPLTIETQVRSLDLAQLESLGERLLDFTSLTDLETWLATELRSR